MRELISARLSGARDELRGGIGVTLYLTAIGAAFFAAGHGHLFIMYWAIPLFIVFPLVNWYIELLEHFPMVGNESVDIATTRPRAVGPVSRHFFGIHAEGYHLDHHLSPKIPFWNLHKAHIVRLRDPEYRAVVERNKPAGKGLLWQFRDMIDRVDKNELNTRIGDLSLKK
jgi:fatty acid desaturase